MDLGDVEHGGHTRVKLGEPAEQDVDKDVLGPVDGREAAEDVLEIVRLALGRAVVGEEALGKPGAQRRLEEMMMRVDEARHHDAALGVDDLGVRCVDGLGDLDDPMSPPSKSPTASSIYSTCPPRIRIRRPFSPVPTGGSPAS
jgi:hypothetical protein